MKSNKQTFQHQLLESLQERGSSTLIKRCVELASEKGTSSWLTVQPIAEHGFHLSKGDFRDDLCLRYHWPLPNVPSPCECGQPFSIDHSMICRKGGFPTLRHNEVRDITADLLKEVCHNVDIEPALQPCQVKHSDMQPPKLSQSLGLISLPEKFGELVREHFWCKGFLS